LLWNIKMVSDILSRLGSLSCHPPRVDTLGKFHVDVRCIGKFGCELERDRNATQVPY